MEDLDKWYWIRVVLGLIFIVSILSGNDIFKLTASLVYGGFLIILASYRLFQYIKNKYLK